MSAVGIFGAADSRAGCRSGGGVAARDLLDVADEPALRCDYFPVGASGVADRPMATALEVVGVGSLGQAETHKEGADRVGADQQVAGKRAVSVILLRVAIHREPPLAVRDGRKISLEPRRCPTCPRTRWTGWTGRLRWKVTGLGAA